VYEDIKKDLALQHPDAYHVDIIRVDDCGDNLKITAEVKTPTTYLVYEYVIDKNSMKIIEKKLLYAIPML